MTEKPDVLAAAPVGDIDIGPREVSRDVLNACKLCWASYGLSAVGDASKLLSSVSASRKFGAVVALLIGAALTVWIVTKLKAGRNWMRLLMTIGTVLGYLAIPVLWNDYVTKVFPLYANKPIEAGVLVLQILPNIGLVILLNTTHSRAWFARMKRDRRNVA